MKNGITQTGQRIRAVRISLGLTPEEFAKMLGTERSVVLMWEHGQLAPRVEDCERIDALGEGAAR